MASLEADLIERGITPPRYETLAQKLSDSVTRFCGSWTFVISFSALTFGWVTLNSILFIVDSFDPYPYIFLNLVLMIVSTFQGPLIMMSQNRQADRDREAVAGIHAKLDRIEAHIRADAMLAARAQTDGGEK